MSAPDPDTHRRTLDFGVRALAQVTQHRTSAEPLAYEVWYEHVVGQHPGLSAEMKQLVARGSLCDADVRDLHARYLSPMRTSQRIDEIGAGTQDEVRSLLASVETTISDLAGMGDDLQATAERLSEPDLSEPVVRGLVEAAVATTRTVCRTHAGLQARLVESQTSIAALHVALDAARDDALRDSLTGLYNRRAFDAQFAARFETASIGSLPLCLVMIDIDHFKSFNDSHGHPVGDQVIRLVGGYLKERVGSQDLPARFGGEEFAIVAVGRSLSDAMALAEEIRRKVEREGAMVLGAKNARARVTVSVGVASRRPGDSTSSLLARADECLYAAKRLGRNRVNTDIATYVEQAELAECSKTGRFSLLDVRSLAAAVTRMLRRAFGVTQRRPARPAAGAVARR